MHNQYYSKGYKCVVYLDVGKRNRKITQKLERERDLCNSSFVLLIFIVTLRWYSVGVAKATIVS